MSSSSAPPMEVDSTPPRRSVVSWVVYDLANTIYSMNIASLYFSLWVVNVMGGRDADFGFATSISFALIFVTAPFLGALTDQASRRLPFLIVSTLLCVAFTATLGQGGLAWSLVAFVAANAAYQAGLQFYDALLPDVSTERNRGWISGVGIGMGYVGSFAGVAVASLLLRGADTLPRDERSARYALVFQATAAMFLLFALPAFVFIRERPHPGRHFTLAAVGAAARQVVTTLRESRRFPGLARFLVGRVFYTDAVNTVIAFMGVYVVNEVGFPASGVATVMLTAISFAAVGGFVWGRVVDRIGPKRTLNLVLYVWMLTFVWVAATGFFAMPRALFWPAACLAGLALGGTWAADRTYMLRLTPPDRVGEFYGLYGMVGRFSAITGPFVWGFVTDVLGLGRPTAVLTLLVGIVVGYLILRPVSDAPREWTPAGAPDERGALAAP